MIILCIKMSAPMKKWDTSKEKLITSSYDGSFLNVFYACVLQFYDVFSFYHKA